MSSLSEVDSSNEADFLADLSSRFNVNLETDKIKKESSHQGKNLSLEIFSLVFVNVLAGNPVTKV